MKVNSFYALALYLMLGISLLLPEDADAAVMNDYCIQPPFIAAMVPPLVMFEMGREHKLFYEAYTDSSDLDDDGVLDIDYKHSIDYYGYFDPYKCYVYDTTGTDKFTPVSRTATKFCSVAGGQWSGNILNWITMTRIDVLKKVLYGGHRSSDSTTETLLERAAIPQDAHSWGKEFTGRLCYKAAGTPQYTHSCSIDSDCASGYTCSDKSLELVGFTAAGVSTCTSATPDTTNNKMLVVRYNHYAGEPAAVSEGNTHTDLLSSFYDATNPLSATFRDYDTSITNFGAAGSKLDPTLDHLDSYSTMVVADFKTSTGSGTETWQFMVDGDDGVEVEIFPATTTGASLGVVASSYGGHAYCSTAPGTLCAGMVTGSLSLTKSSTWYRMVARHTENGGQDGIRVWYNKANAGWKLFGTTNLGNNNMRAYDITDTNKCTLLASEFITKGVPTSGVTSSDSSKRHMVCNTTLSDGGTPVMRLLKDVTGKRIWEWASKERPVCDNSLGAPTDYDVRVKVCDSTIDSADQLDIKKSEIGDSCKLYPGSGGTWKPVGLLQQYGEGDGSKVCSKNMSKPCNTDAGCAFATEGKCVDKADMYFGMFSTSYEKNLSGGVLRKNIGAILDESNANSGIFQSSESSQGNIILTFDRLKNVGFRYSDWSYQDASGGSCGWITDRSLAEGECRNWGNPIGEMMYESLRYLAGKLSPTSEFTYAGTQDSGLQLSKPDWGYKDGSDSRALYEIYPSCAKPFILMLSDTNTSYDSDQIPGSSYTKSDGTSFVEDAATPQLGLGTTLPSGRSLLNELAYTIGQTEAIHGNSWYIGENGTTKDFLCTGKTASQFSLLRGMCPEEPTKKGSYYVAALAYYGKTQFKTKTGKPDVNTFAIALSSPFSELKFKTASGTISFLPTGKSVSGDAGVYNACAQRMNLTNDATYGLRINPKSPADAAAYCPTNTIVDYYIDDIRYDSSNNMTYALFRINYEDVEQGADHDMDAIVRYEICTAIAATNGYGTCGTSTLAANQVEIKLYSDYAAGGIDQVMGFIISGTTEDGVYLPVKDKDIGGSDANTPAVVADLPLNWSKEFTIGATAGARSLRNPLWYAAKWGGFEDKNGNNLPDQKDEWAKECTSADVSQCNPDNYYQVVNPLRLRRQLNKALTDILRRVSSGTAASILNNSEGSGANLLQAVFYPVKSFDSSSETSWIGEMQNLWYFLDPALQNTSIREDSNQNNTLNLKSDLVAQFYFDPTENKTLVKRFADNNGDGAADDPSSPVDTVSPDDVKSLWKAGRMLWERNVTTDPRTIYTGDSSTFDSTPQKFSNLAGDGYYNTWPNTWTALQIPAGTDAQRTALATKLISYVHGNDQVDDAAPCLNSDCKYRPRKVTILGCNTGIYAGRVPDNNCTREWRLGDIISSTPKLISNVPLNQYNLSTPRGYNDSSYKNFTLTSTYLHRGMVLVGGNDGMLHAFKLGVLKELNGKFDKAQMNDASGSLADTADKLGREEWAYIPKNVMPYLKYLTDANYSHLYYVDRTPTVFDASIGKPAGCGTDYSDCPKASDGSTWRTVVIGGMGIGGASRDTSSACSTATDCVKNPLAGNGYSSYFALDVTDPANPKALWEFAGDPGGMGTLGYSTTGPAIVRISKKDASGNPDNTKNGKWFAVFASGPTGPIDTTSHQFKGQSDQNLKLFIVDIGTGSLVKTIDTGVTNAFAGSLASSWIDTDRSNPTSSGFYGDDAVYIGYVQKDTTVTPNTWTKGGVLRLLTRESDDPASVTPTKQWDVHSLLSGTGPVTTSVTKLQDRANKTMWVFFGTGRFYFKADDPSTGTTQKVYGIKDPCYYTSDRKMMAIVPGGTTNDYDQTCTDAATTTTTTTCTGSSTALCDQSGIAGPAVATLPPSMGGWFINLDAADTSYLGERVVTDPVASSAGAVFFTTFKPSADICKFGGDTFIWASNYASGGPPPDKAMEGKALIQVSTGAFKELSLKKAFDWQHPEEPPINPITDEQIQRYDKRRTLQAIPGVPPTAQGLSLITNPPPVKKFLHVREK